MIVGPKWPLNGWGESIGKNFDRIAGLRHVLDPHVARRMVDGRDHRRVVRLCSLKTHTAPKSTS
jgi:hypothetical protein